MKDFIYALLIATLGILLVGYMHFGIRIGNMVSSYNAYSKEKQQVGINHAYAKEFIAYHDTHSTFKRRMLTTKTVQRLSNFFAIELGTAFVIVSGIALWLCGLVLFYVSKSLSYGLYASLLSVIIFYTSYSVLLAFHVTNYTYDEPLQYLFLFLSYLFLLRHKLLYFGLAFCLAALARETSLFFLPAIFFYSYARKNYSFIWISAIVAIVFISFQLLYFKTDMSALHTEQSFRFTLWKQNLATPLFRIETIVSFLLVLLIPMFLVFQKGINSNWQLHFLFLIFINSLIVVLFTEARESRLFALPLILFWPRGGDLAIDFVRSHWPRTLRLQAFHLILFVIHAALVLLVFIFLNESYDTTITPRQYTWNMQYAKIVTVCFGLLLYLKSATVFAKYLNR